MGNGSQGRLGERGHRGGEDVNSILNTSFFTHCSFLGDFCTENIILKKKEWSSTEQASNEPGGTFLQIQTDICV